MELRIVHVTGFEYDGRARASYNEARMTPQTAAHQTVRHSRVEVLPHPWTQTYRDYWGTTVTAFEVLDPHSSLTVTATSTVRAEDRPAPRAAASWEELRDPLLVDDLAEYLTVSDRVRPPGDLAAQVDALVGDGATPGEVARDVCGLVHDEVEYLPGATDVHAQAADAWE